MNWIPALWLKHTAYRWVASVASILRKRMIILSQRFSVFTSVAQGVWALYVVAKHNFESSKLLTCWNCGLFGKIWFKKLSSYRVIPAQKFTDRSFRMWFSHLAGYLQVNNVTKFLPVVFPKAPKFSLEQWYCRTSISQMECASYRLLLLRSWLC